MRRVGGAVKRSAALVRASVTVARHPRLWPTAVRQASALRAPGRLSPAPTYLDFRMVTQYGAADARPRGADVVAYLEWCRHWRALER